MGEKLKDALIFADSDNGGIIHVANIKGGVGKSTVATNLAAALSKRGPTLLIDLDVQGSATVALGKDTTAVSFSSWELFKRRFTFPVSNQVDQNSSKFEQILNSTWTSAKSFIQQKIVSKPDLPGIALKVMPCLDLIPANSDLFKSYTWFHLQNLIYNIHFAREYYKYVVIDTPSIWNSMTRALFLQSNLNLIPVTLNALSTKSLKDYLCKVKSLAETNPQVKIRIVKNEVFGRQDSKIKGKIRTMNENRRYLEHLCEQTAIESQSGFSFLPQSIMFDLEIPESATIRDAQDEGKSVHEYHQYSAISRAFEELAKRVQYVLNTPVPYREKKVVSSESIVYSLRAAAFIIAIGIFVFNSQIAQSSAPRPIAPQQLVASDDNIIRHTFTHGDNIYKVAKYAICHFRAKVPNSQDVVQYAKEVVDIYNMTRLSGEPFIRSLEAIPNGITMFFYPPGQVRNPDEKLLLPVYKYFISLVKDEFAYITGDWCERGTGGGQPHYGMDVAAKFGTPILSPIDGIVVTKNNNTTGRTVGIVNKESIIFFCHLDKRFVNDGAYIHKGQALGTVGMTGRTSGPHVHIGYGVKAQSRGDIAFGTQQYRVTDPKHFFYRKLYFDGLANAETF